MRKSIYILIYFLIVLLFYSCNKVSDPSITIAQDLPTLGNSGVDFEEEYRDEVIETTSAFTEFRHKYMDKALDYEYSKPYIVKKLNTYDIDDMTIEEKYSLLLEAKKSKTGYLRSISTESKEDDVFYEQLNNQMMEEIDKSTVVISSSPIDPSTIKEETPFVQSAEGISFNKLELLQMAEEQYAEEKSESSRAFIKTSTKKWGYSIPYRFESNVNSDTRTVIRGAMNDWEAAANNRFRFVQMQDSFWNAFLWTLGISQHLKIKKINMQNVAGQATLGKGSWKSFDIADATHSTCLHELGHVLGLEHEHTRYDRDNYVNIYWNNIMDGPWYSRDAWRSQYHKIDEGYQRVLYITIKFAWWTWTIKVNLGYNRLSQTYGNFDYASIMIYPSYGFSKNGLYTMLKKNGAPIGDPKVLSENDKKAIRQIY